MMQKSLVDTKTEPNQESALQLDKFTEDALRLTFELFDKENEGLISLKTIANNISLYGNHLSPGEVSLAHKKIYNNLFEPDPQYRLNFNQFAQLIMSAHVQGYEEEELKLTFDMLDADQDGLISKADLCSMEKLIGIPLSSCDIDYMLTNNPNDSSRGINFERFKREILPQNEK